MTSEAASSTDWTALRQRRLARKRVTSIVAHLVLVICSIAMLYPLLWMLSAAFRPENEIFSSDSLIPSAISFDAFGRGWQALQVSFCEHMAQVVLMFPTGMVVLNSTIRSFWLMDNNAYNMIISVSTWPRSCCPPQGWSC